MGLRFFELDTTYDRDDFDCGVPELNKFLKNDARQQQSKNLNRTFVLTNDKDNPLKILAYYSISMCEVTLYSLPESYKKKLPRYPIPAARIGRLAVDQEQQKNGFGKLCLIDALKRIKIVSSSIGVYAVIVDAKNDKARGFYEYYGFISFVDDPLSLFIPLSRVND